MGTRWSALLCHLVSSRAVAQRPIKAIRIPVSDFSEPVHTSFLTQLQARVQLEALRC